MALRFHSLLITRAPQDVFEPVVSFMTGVLVELVVQRRHRNLSSPDFGVHRRIINGEVGMALSVVASMTFGIVVDDTVHFLSKYLRARREQGLRSEDAVRYAFNTVGRALIVTTIVLVAGFLVLSASNFGMNSKMGLSVAIIIACALATVLLFLPPLLMKLDARQEDRLRG